TFNADLMELAITSLLRTLVTKHRAGIPKLLGLVKQQAMLLGRPHTTRSAFRAQSQTVAVAVEEGVHFFLDDVRYFANGALEQIGLFNHWHADFVIAIRP